MLEFSALGLAISTLVTVVEILRQNQLRLHVCSPILLHLHVSESKLPYSLETYFSRVVLNKSGVHTSTVNAQESHEGDFKAKMEVTVKRSSTYQQMKPGDEEEGK